MVAAPDMRSSSSSDSAAHANAPVEAFIADPHCGGPPQQLTGASLRRRTQYLLHVSAATRAAAGEHRRRRRKRREIFSSLLRLRRTRDELPCCRSLP